MQLLSNTTIRLLKTTLGFLLLFLTQVYGQKETTRGNAMHSNTAVSKQAIEQTLKNLRTTKGFEEEKRIATLLDSLITHYPFNEPLDLKEFGLVELHLKSANITLVSYGLSFQQEMLGAEQYKLFSVDHNKENTVDKISHAFLEPTLDYTLANKNQNEFYPGVFYEAIELPGKNKFLLLGFNNTDPVYNTKFIETLQISGKTLKFGVPMLKTPRKKLRRYILRYSNETTVTLKYNEKEKLIFFPHLAPREPRYRNNFAFYGPDGSFDGFRFVKNQWVLEEDLDMRNPKKSGKKYNAPPKTPGVNTR
ncbi:MAG: hypothetical protein ACXITV_11215 [Luteibaculaceae bacterium]